VQFADGAIEAQLSVCENSAALVPVTRIFAIDNVLVPGFEIVMVCAALVESIRWLPKVTEVADKLICGETPVPLSATACGEPEALSVTDIDALRLPVAEGVNVT
jgi:hypothetical protein